MLIYLICPHYFVHSLSKSGSWCKVAILVPPEPFLPGTLWVHSCMRCSQGGILRVLIWTWGAHRLPCLKASTILHQRQREALWGRKLWSIHIHSLALSAAFSCFLECVDAPSALDVSWYHWYLNLVSYGFLLSSLLILTHLQSVWLLHRASESDGES